MWLVAGGSGIFFCNANALHPVSSCAVLPVPDRGRVIHALNVPTYSFQGTAAFHALNFSLRWLMAWCLFVHLQNRASFRLEKVINRAVMEQLAWRNCSALNSQFWALYVTHERRELFNSNYCVSF